MAIGIVIALLQALTQVQEVTLTFIPKIIAILLVCLAHGARSSARSSTPSPSRSTRASRSGSSRRRVRLGAVSTLAQGSPAMLTPADQRCGERWPHSCHSVKAVERDSGQDVGFAVGIVFILTVLFLPLPAVLIDIGLAVLDRARRC